MTDYGRAVDDLRTADSGVSGMSDPIEEALEALRAERRARSRLAPTGDVDAALEALAVLRGRLEANHALYVRNMRFEYELRIAAEASVVSLKEALREIANLHASRDTVKGMPQTGAYPHGSISFLIFPIGQDPRDIARAALASSEGDSDA